jgi:hypothetical protein
MRGQGSYDSTELLLEGWSVHYNCVRPHQSLDDKTPAQAAKMDVPNTWLGLIEEATKQEAIENGYKETQEQVIEPSKDMIELEVIAQ